MLAGEDSGLNGLIDIVSEGPYAFRPEFGYYWLKPVATLYKLVVPRFSPSAHALGLPEFQTFTEAIAQTQDPLHHAIAVNAENSHGQRSVS